MKMPLKVEINNVRYSILRKIFYDNGVIIFPTDTVYGIGGDPFNINVVNRIKFLKRRSVNPFPILIDSIDRMRPFIRYSRVIEDLAELIWPGPYTIISKAQYKIPAIFNSEFIGFRIPDEENLLKIIKSINGYMIGTSANISGRRPATSIDEAREYFSNKVDMYINGGVRKNPPSTLIVVDDDLNEIFIDRLYDRYEIIHIVRKICNKYGYSIKILSDLT